MERVTAALGAVSHESLESSGCMFCGTSFLLEETLSDAVFGRVQMDCSWIAFCQVTGPE